MSYKYDPQNGYRNADQIGADEEDFNKDILDIIKPIKKLTPSDVRTAINVISCKEKRQEINQETIESNRYIKINSNLVSDIQKDIEGEQVNKIDDDKERA